MNKRSIRSYRIWKSMKSRCYSKSNNKGYYKSDGIKVCDEWLHDYQKFMEDMGEPEGDDYSIERIDVRGDYCKSNCKWIRMREQPINRRTTIFITFAGRTECLKEWSRILNMNYSTLIKRIKRQGLSFEDATSKEREALYG